MAGIAKLRVSIQINPVAKYLTTNPIEIIKRSRMRTFTTTISSRNTTHRLLMFNRLLNTNKSIQKGPTSTLEDNLQTVRYKVGWTRMLQHSRWRNTQLLKRMIMKVTRKKWVAKNYTRIYLNKNPIISISTR